MLDFVQIMFQCGFQSGLIKMNVGLDPFQMFLWCRPSFPPFLGLHAEQEFAQPMPCLQLVFLGRFPSPYQIPQGLMRGIRHHRHFRRDAVGRLSRLLGQKMLVDITTERT